MQDNLNLENVLVLDPKVNVEETFRPKEVIHKSGVNKSRFVIPSDAYSNSNFLWQNVVPPSSTTIVERVLRVKYTATVSVVRAGANPAYPGGVRFPYLDGNGVLTFGQTASGVLRDFPLQQACSGIDLKINGNSCSVCPSDYITVFPHLLTDDEQNLYCSEFPSQKDSSTVYTQANGANNTVLSARTPFAQYSQNSTAPSRASFVAKSAVIADQANAGTDIYTFEITETLIISPMTWGSGVDTGMGLSNIQNITLNVKFDNLNRMVSVMTSALAGGTVSVAVNATKPELLMEYITQTPELEARQPLELVYPYEIIQAYRTPITNPATFENGAKVSVSIPGNTIKLGSIPDRVMIFVAPSKSALSGDPALSQQITGTFLRITNLSLNFNNRISLFNSYSEADLYKMSVSNGLKDTFHEYKYTGSIIILDITKDVQLPPGEMAGQSSSYMTIQPNVVCDNSPLQYGGQTTACAYDLVCVPIISGKAVISKQQMQLILVAPNGDEVLKAVADANAKVDSNALANVDGKAYGGSLFGSTAKKLLHSGLDYLSKNPEHLSTGLNAVKGMLGGDVSAGKLKKHSKSKRVY
jgi:hypothetical protein